MAHLGTLMMPPTLQIAFSAHGCFMHAFLHLCFEHCSELAQSESLEQHLCSSRPSAIVTHKTLRKTMVILIYVIIF